MQVLQNGRSHCEIILLSSIWAAGVEVNAKKPASPGDHGGKWQESSPHPWAVVLGPSGPFTKHTLEV